MNAPGNGAGPNRRRRIRTRMTPPPPPDFCRVPPAGNPAAATRSVASIRVDRQPAGRPARTAAAAGRRLPGRPAEPRSRRPAGIYPSDERPHAPPSRAGPRRPAEGPLPSPPRRVGKSRENLAGISRELGRGGGGPFPRRRRVAARGEASLACDRAWLASERSSVTSRSGSVTRWGSAAGGKSRKIAPQAASPATARSRFAPAAAEVLAVCLCHEEKVMSPATARSPRASLRLLGPACQPAAAGGGSAGVPEAVEG